MKPIPAIRLAIASLLGVLSLVAQSNLDGPVPPAIAPGNPESSYSLSGVDHVNYFNGSLQIDIPLLKVGGRSEAAQNIIRPVGNQQWLVDPGTLVPLRGDATADSYGAYSIGGWIGNNSGFTTFNGSPCSDPGSPVYQSYLPSSPVLTWLTWNKPDQTETPLADEKSNGAAQPGTTDGCTTYDRGKVFHSYDGSSLTYVSDQEIHDDVPGGFTGKLLFGNGTQYIFSLAGTNPVVTILDRNGNQATQQTVQSSNCGYTRTIVDSAGRTETINFIASPNCPGSDTITFPGSTQSGAQRTVTVNYDLLQNRLVTGLPLGQQVQTPKCLFPQLNGSSFTLYNPLVVSSIVLPDGSSYYFMYNYYGEVMQMGLPAGGVIAYQWPLPSSCSDPSGASGAVVWNGGFQASIYRRVQERDEYANGFSGGLTGKIVYTRTSLSSNADPSHPNRSNGYGTMLDADIQDGAGNQLRHETHWFYGDPSQSAAIPSDPTTYPAWSDGLEFQTQISQAGSQRQLQQKLWQQQPCSGCWFNPSLDTSARMNVPLVCQQNTTLDSTSDTSSILSYYDFASNVTNNLTGLYEYDFGSAPGFGTNCPASAPGGWFRATSSSYWFSTSNAAYGPVTAGALTNANLFTLPRQKTVQGSDGSQAIDYFSYDETAPQNAAGAPGHDDGDFGTSYNSRGNLTTHQVWDNVAGTYPAETFTYDETGRALSHKDFNSHTTSYTYGDGAHIFPTAVTNALNQTRSWTWDANILQPLTATDENNSVTQYNYNGDPLDRPTSVVRALGVGGLQSNTTYGYPSVTQTTVRQDQNSTGDGALRTDQFIDGLGRQTQTVTYENASSTITTTTAYDTLGRPVWVSNPYRAGDPIYYTHPTYDVLNRTLCVASTYDGAQTCTAYNGKQATITDAAGNTKVQVTDAAGRLKSVTEDPSGMNYQTTYQYDALDDLTKVTQGSQTRTFGFDSRGRLRSTTNPENGTTSYGYDANSNLTSRTDNQGVATTYGYDALNRMTSMSYSGARTAPSVAYYYDTGSPNAVGRLVSVWNSQGTSQQIWGYDALGRITSSSETIGGTSQGSFSYGYNLADALVWETYPTGRTVNTAYDGANRSSGVTGVLNGASTTYVANATYAASGAIGAFNYAVTNGVAAGTRSFSYNGNMQLGEMHDQASSLLDLKYFYGGATTTGAPGGSTGANNGNPTGIVEAARKGSGTLYNFTQTYGYDRLNRLSTATDTGGWTQNFNFDRYGNPWTTANSGLPGDRLPTSNVYNAANNQSSYPGTQYDVSGVGNQTQMGGMQLTFDAESRIVQSYNTVSQNSTCYGYDGSGERVYKWTFGGNTCSGTPGTTIAYVYDAFGNLALEQDTGIATQSACATCYLTGDHAGSVRMVSDAAPGGFTGFHDYAPFGGEVLGGYAGRSSDWGTQANGNDNLSQRYTGAERDAESTLDFLQARYLANMQARFVSADPAGNLAANPGDPQSWNMYSYVRNNPLAFIDPSGLTTCDVNGNNCYDSVTVDGGSGGGVPFDCFFYSFLCGGGWTGPGLTISAPPPPPPPPPPSKPKLPFGSCMENHASDFSLAGFLDNGLAAAGRTNVQPGHAFLGSAIGGNNLTGAYFALFGNSDQSTSNAVTTAANQGLVGDIGIVGAIGQNLTAGSRTSSLISLNLKGKPGPGAQVLARSPALRKTLGRVSLVGKITTIIDAGLALGEAIDCAVGALP